jgi:cytochrome c
LPISASRTPRRPQVRYYRGHCDANKNSGITWNEAEFKEYIRDPKAKIPGTKMAFAGIKNDKEVNDLWAFISQYDKDGKTK